VETHSQITEGAATRRVKRAPKAQQTAPRDYVAIAIKYARSTTQKHNQQHFGRWMKLAAARFLNDLKRARAKNPPFYFDRWAASDPCDFIEKLPHIEGSWDTDTITLHPSDIFFLVNLFGFRQPDGTRRFTTALKAIARKNAKSTIAAAIGLYCQTCEGEQGPQVVTAATTGAQARVVFNIARRMVEQTSELRDAFRMEPFVNAIACYDNGGQFRPINAKASTQDGLNPSTVILDEIHAHKSHDLLNVLRSAAGARHNPLFLYTTTEGYESPGPWPELRHFAQQVLQGIVEADHFLAVYYAVDEDDAATGTVADSDFDEAAWIKANPLMDVNPLLLKEIRKEALEAKAMPGRHAEFKIKRLNRSSSVAGGWVNIVKWRACTGAVDLQWLRQFPCWGGLDLASTRDLTSFRLLWHVEDIWYTHGWRFVPHAAVVARGERGMVPYEAWRQGGWLIEAGEDVTDYDAIERCIVEVAQRFSLQSVGYDVWNARQLVPKLETAGVQMVEVTQGPRSYHPAMKALELAYVSGKFCHGNDPVLNWCASNVVARTDQNMNTAPDKRRAPDKIDDIVALLMAFVMATSETEAQPKYQMLFV
jgi:phage terminase large subunit-like protein